LYGQQAFTNTNDSIAFFKADEAFHLANKNSDSALLIANQSLSQANTSKNKRAIFIR